MRQFFVSIVGTANATTQEISAHITGAAPVLVPGVTDWDVLAVSGCSDCHCGWVMIAANVTAEDVVTDNSDYPGQEVTADFVSSYITGAGEHWLTSETFSLFPDDVTVLPYATK